MEPIKINVSVELNLSQVTKDFILSVFNGVVAQPATQASAKPAEQKPVTQVSAKPATQASAKPAEQKPAAQTSTHEISIEDVRKALSLKVNDHRAEIKDKLNEFGSPSVTKLDPANYKEMLDFLNALD